LESRKPMPFSVRCSCGHDDNLAISGPRHGRHVAHPEVQVYSLRGVPHLAPNRQGAIGSFGVGFR